MEEIKGVQWDDGGNPYAVLGDFDGEKTLMKFWCSTDPAGQEFLEKFNLEENVQRLAEVLDLHQMVISIANLTWAFERLKDSGQLTTPAPANVPLTRAGVPMTEAQQRWSEYREFSETHSSAECRARAQQDSQYAEFIRLNREREFERPGERAETYSSSSRRNSGSMISTAFSIPLSRWRPAVKGLSYLAAHTARSSSIRWRSSSST